MCGEQEEKGSKEECDVQEHEEKNLRRGSVMYKSMRKKLKEAGEEDVANCNHEKALEKQ